MELLHGAYLAELWAIVESPQILLDFIDTTSLDFLKTNFVYIVPDLPQDSHQGYRSMHEICHKCFLLITISLVQCE